MSSDAKNKRFKYLWKANVVKGRTMSDLNQRREDELPNKGNRSGNHHSSTAETQKIADDLLRKYAKSRESFSVQAAGNADPNNRTKADGTP